MIAAAIMSKQAWVGHAVDRPSERGFCLCGLRFPGKTEQDAVGNKGTSHELYKLKESQLVGPNF